MEAMFLTDLENASEIVLDAGRKVRAPNQPRHPHPVLRRGGGSSGRAAAGVVRIANVVGAAFTNRRVLEPVEARITVGAGALLLSLATLFAMFPRFIAYLIALLFAWIASALLVQGYKLHRTRVMRKAATNIPSAE
jgi:cardiolipin synthase